MRLSTVSAFPRGRGRHVAGDDVAVTLAEVARHARVSLATASRALNGSTRRVTPELQRRVLASAAALGYAANAQAQAVARGASRTVAVVLGDIADPYFSAIASGIIRVAEDHGLVVTMATTHSGIDRELATLAALKGQRPRALIMAASRRIDEDSDARAMAEFTAIERMGGRVSFIGSAPPGFRAVVVRNRRAAGALAEALVDRGYRDFAVLAGPAGLVTPAERAAGFLEALAARGVVPESGGVVAGAFTRDGGYRAMTGLIEGGVRPDCVFAVTDAMAVGAMAALRDHGLEPGRDVAVAGFDDIQMLQDVTPSLTTVALPLVEMGAGALELALTVDPPGPPPQISVEGRVMLRDSTPGVRRR